MDDLEQFWSNLLSDNPGLIAKAWSMLDVAEREAVAAHLRAMSSDPERHPGQRSAAQVALTVVAEPPASRLLLASGSPRRRELVALLGLPFDVTSSNADETPHPGEDPTAMVTRLSQEKARAVLPTLAPSHDPTIVLTADTTVSLDGEILAKPADVAEARSMLARLRGRSHRVFTAITLVESASGRAITDLASTEVPMRDYGDREMEAYIATGDPFDKAGGYAIQHGGFNPVATLRGCYANVVGLPLCHVMRSLRRLGVDVSADVPTACQRHLEYECPVYTAILGGQPALQR